MGFLDRFKKSREKQVGKKAVAAKILGKEKAKPEDKKEEKIREARVASKKTDTGMAFRHLIKPMVSEKASVLASQGKYVFVVHPYANKIQIKKAVEEVFGVKVNDVNIIKMLGKNVRFGRVRGRTKNWKKAVVTLEPGQKIEIYEGV